MVKKKKKYRGINLGRPLLHGERFAFFHHAGQAPPRVKETMDAHALRCAEEGPRFLTWNSSGYLLGWGVLEYEEEEVNEWGEVSP